MLFVPVVVDDDLGLHAVKINKCELNIRFVIIVQTELNTTINQFSNQIKIRLIPFKTPDFAS